MGKVIRLSIRRSNPGFGEPPYDSIYEMEADRDMTILEILNQIYNHMDPTLAYRRYRCGRRLCRSCEVKLDGKTVRGCDTLLTPGKSYRLEPARTTSLIRDLVFTFDSPKRIE
jgi:fumarate reductase iron-sulfur subunit